MYSDKLKYKQINFSCNDCPTKAHCYEMKASLKVNSTSMSLVLLGTLCNKICHKKRRTIDPRTPSMSPGALAQTGGGPVRGGAGGEPQIVNTQTGPHARRRPVLWPVFHFNTVIFRNANYQLSGWCHVRSRRSPKQLKYLPLKQ